MHCSTASASFSGPAWPSVREAMAACRRSLSSASAGSWLRRARWPEAAGSVAVEMGSEEAEEMDSGVSVGEAGESDFMEAGEWVE